MSILSGIKKVIPYFKNADGNYEQLSYKTSSQTVDFDDGKTAETKLGAIKGITTSTSVTETGYAADAKIVSEINQSLEDHFSVEFIASSVNAVSGALVPNEYQNINYDIIVILWNPSNGLYDEFRFIGSAFNSAVTNRSMSHGGYTSANYYERSQILMNSGRITLNSWIQNGTEYKTTTLMTIVVQKKRSEK